ncbi:MAG: hypothetical protein LBV04_07410 [Deferribacteraceae bacterium]|jgi:hypothetical protein|nr:hypothetical protein [Deferribacteraceae bacterium]
MKKIVIAVLMFTMVFSAVVFAANDAVEKLCSGCHATENVYNASKRTTQRWDSTYTRMVRHGLKATPEDEKAVKEYLYTLVP